MPNASFLVSIENKIDTVKMSGHLDEDFAPPRFNLEGKSIWQIDLGEIKFINSAGLRHWMVWLGNIEKKFGAIQTILTGLPGVFLRQMASVVDHFSNRVSFLSIYALYSCRDCNNEDYELIDLCRDCKLGDDFEVQIQILKKCPKCHIEMRIDDSLNSQNLLTFFYSRRSQ